VIKWLACFVVLAILHTGLLAVQVKSCQSKRGAAAEQQSHVDQGVADAHASQAKDSDAKVADLQTKLDTKAKDLDRLLAERDALRLRLLSARTPSHDPVSPNPPEVEPVSDPRDAVISKDDEVIKSQANLIELDSHRESLGHVNGRVIAIETMCGVRHSYDGPERRGG